MEQSGEQSGVLQRSSMDLESLDLEGLDTIKEEPPGCPRVPVVEALSPAVCLEA